MSKGKVEREIEDILVRLDEFVAEESRLRRARRRLRLSIGRSLRGVTGCVPRPSVGHAMLAAFGLIVLALILNAYDLGVARVALIAGLVLFFGSFILSIRGAGRPREEKRWRGQVIDLSGPTLGDRVRGWFRRDRRHR